MKFIFVITNLTGGGAEKVILNLCANLNKKGHNAKMVLLEKKINYELPEGLVIECVSEGEVSKGWLGKRLLAYKLKNKLKNINYDLLVSTLPLADEVCVLAGLKKHVCRIANNLSQEITSSAKEYRLNKKLNKIKKLYSGRRLVAVSKGVENDLVFNFGFLGKDVFTIYNSYDFDRIKEQSKEGFKVNFDGDYILHVGRFSPQKRHDVLFEAFDKIKDIVRCRMVLLTEDSDDLRLLIKKHELDKYVFIAGFQKNPYVWMSHAKMVVLSSDYEGLPNVLIESLICGQKVVSTDCPSGPKEIMGIEAEKFLVPCGDSSRLAEVIVETALTDKFPQVNLERFEIKSVLAQWEKLALENF